MGTKRSIGKTLVHNWKKRFFKLYYYGKLAYYVKQDDNEPKGSLQLTWDMQVRAASHRSNSFQLKSASVDATMQASDPQQMAEWMQALQKVIDGSVQGSDQSQTRFVV